MKKKGLAFISILAVFSAAFTLVVVPARAETATTPIASQPTETLVAPVSYEQYLPLNNPTDVAVSENYLAIADGNGIYIYDRADGEYRLYKHGEENKQEDRIAKLQFDEYETLYFLDGSTATNFYSFNVETGEETPIALACGTFTVQGGELYFTNAQEDLYKASLNGQSLSPVSLQWENVSSLAFLSGELYFIQSDYYLMKIDPTLALPPNPAKATYKIFEKQIAHVSVSDGALSCTSADGEFFSYALTQTETPVFQSSAEGYARLCAFGENVYAVQPSKGAIKQYSTKQGAFTDYEISANSASRHRLSGAKTTFLAGDKLYIADNGNARISVYDTRENKFLAPFNATLPPSYICADENYLLAATDTQATLYSLSAETYGEPSAQFSNFNGKLVGVACVYGKFYLATDHNECYALTLQAETGEWTRESHRKSSTRYPKALTSDVYGNLYILSGREAYRFTEREFLSDTEEGEKVGENLPTSTTQIAVDYNQTLYALSDNGLFLESTELFRLRARPVYYADALATPSLTSFAIGIEENETYLLCEGNYLLKSTALSLPTVKTVAVNGANENIFSQAAAEFSVVKTQENTLLVEFDLHATNGAEYFPYLGYSRETTPKTALKIGETQTHYLLAEYDAAKETYRTYLALQAHCTPLAPSEYRTAYSETEQRTGYITSAIALYKFPYLTELLTSGTLGRGDEVVLIGEVRELDHAYYEIAFTDAQGETITGYVPQAFVTDFSGIPPVSETIERGETESDHDSVWRLAYLLLGFAAICILTDFLILRKKKGGDDYE
ncbi:MAG: hypothetical protein IJW60_01805 [Clostridia bacterium]|nr:hypothetical protein [Clostridia bacterium]